MLVVVCTKEKKNAQKVHTRFYSVFFFFSTLVEVSTDSLRVFTSWHNIVEQPTMCLDSICLCYIHSANKCLLTCAVE